MFGCQKQFLISVFLCSASICGAVEDGVYSCKVEVSCGSNQNNRKDLKEGAHNKVREEFDEFVKKKQITDKIVKEILFYHGIRQIYFDFGVANHCKAPTDLDFKLDHYPGFQLTPRAEFEKLYPPKQLVVTPEEMTLFFKSRERDFSGIKDGGEATWKYVDRMVTFRIAARDENFVIGEFDRFKQENNPDNQVSLPLLHNTFVKFTGDRLTTTYMSINRSGDYMAQGITRSRCEKL